MSKRKILLVAMTLCMVAILAVGGTLAYFTDTDNATNVFTTGNVSIDLQETFTQDSLLMPGINVNKDAWILNDGKQAAYVWAEVLIPAALDDADGNSPDAPGLGNSLHWNYPGMYAEEYAQNTNPDGKFYNDDLSQLWFMQHNADDLKYGFAGNETIDNVKYNKFVMFYKDKLEANEKTSFFIDKVYMDSKVTQAETAGTYILADGKTPYAGPWQIIVRAYGIQADGFNNVFDAWKAYVKENGAN